MYSLSTLALPLVSSIGLLPFALGAPWNCRIEIGTKTWDLASLNTEKTVTAVRSSPPSEFQDEIRWNVCDVLKPREGYDSNDQCASTALACLTETNKKPNDGGDRITAVIPLADSSTLDVQYKLISGVNGVSLALHGPQYPPSSSNAIRQTLNFTLLCATSDSEPKLTQYDRTSGTASIEWSVKAACPTSSDGDDKPPADTPNDGDNKGATGGGGGFGWFLLLILFGFVAYFGLGAYYNYNNYGATGWDLVPHRDFWREVPYLFEDLLSYLFSSVRSGGGNRSGYVSV